MRSQIRGAWLAIAVGRALLAQEPWIPSETMRLLRERPFSASQAARWFGDFLPEINRDGEYVLGIDEEWPSSMSGTKWVFAPKMFNRIVNECRKIQLTVPSIQDLHTRILVQNELWTMFDCVLFDVGDDSRNSQSQKYQVEFILWHLAQAIRRLAPSEADLRLNRYHRQMLVSSWLQFDLTQAREFMTHESSTAHEFAHGFRRISRVTVAQRDWGAYWNHSIEPDQESVRVLPDGSEALLEESAMVILDTGRIAATEFPLLLRHYSVVDAGPGRAMRWRMAYIGADGAWYDADTRTGAWAHLDLPNIPTDPALAERVPWQQSCSNCHGTKTLSIRPGYLKRDLSQVRWLPVVGATVPSIPEFVAKRAESEKIRLPEFTALMRYWAMPEPSMDWESPAQPLKPSRSADSSGWLMALGAAFLLIIGVRRAWLWHRIRSS